MNSNELQPLNLKRDAIENFRKLFFKIKLRNFMSHFITDILGQLGYAEIHLGSPTVIKSPDYPRSLGPQVQMEWR